MKLLAVHPGCLMYSKIYLRLEPLGLELVAAACRRAGYDVRVIDLQVESHRDYFRLIDGWRPDAVAFSCNYLANVPEIIDLAKATRKKLPDSLIMVGGHSASFTARELLEHSDGALNCVLRGEGEAGMPAVLEAFQNDRTALARVRGVVTLEGEGPRPGFVKSLDDLIPAQICCAIGDAISSVFSTPVPRSSSVAGALGIASFAAPGRFTVGVTAQSRPPEWWKNSLLSRNPAFFSSMMLPSSKPITECRSVS